MKSFCNYTLIVTLQWIQSHNTPCGQAVKVCGFGDGPQNNWLITQLINRTVNGTRLPQVSVTIELTQLDCSSSLMCKQDLNTHMHETSKEDREGARNIEKYQQIGSVSSGDTFDKLVNQTITINLNTNHSSFYFAIQDEGSCTTINRLIIFYYACPAKTFDLISYPKTLAVALGRNISVTASCVENAQPNEDELNPIVTCLAEGVWSDTIGGAGCHCTPGHYRENETCIGKLNLYPCRLAI